MHYIKRPLKALKVIITLNSKFSTLNPKSSQLSKQNIYGPTLYAPLPPACSQRTTKC